MGGATKRRFGRVGHVVSVAVFLGALMGIAVAQNQGRPTVGAVGVAAGSGADASTVIIARRKGQMLASDVIGATAYSRGGRELGEVRDLLLAESGELAGFVVAVGGVFGVGAKVLAVPVDQAQIVMDKDGGMSGLRVAFTRMDAESAPPFRGDVAAQMGAVSSERGSPGESPHRPSAM